MVWVGGDLTDHPVPTSCPGQGPLPPAQGAPSPVQPSLEPCQGGGSHSSSGQPGPAPHHPHGKNFFLISNLNLPSFSFKLSLLVLSLQALVTCLSIFLTSPLYVLQSHKKLSPQPSLPQAEQPQLSQPSLSAEGFQPSHHCWGLFWTCSGHFRDGFILGTGRRIQELHTLWAGVNQKTKEKKKSTVSLSFVICHQP